MYILTPPICFNFPWDHRASPALNLFYISVHYQWLVHIIPQLCPLSIGLLPDTQNCGLHIRRECREHNYRTAFLSLAYYVLSNPDDKSNHKNISIRVEFFAWNIFFKMITVFTDTFIGKWLMDMVVVFLSHGAWCNKFDKTWYVFTQNHWQDELLYWNRPALILICWCNGWIFHFFP